MTTPSGRLKVHTVEVEKLPSAIADRMWDLFAESYDNVSRAKFDLDLAEKSGVFVGLDSGDNSFQGFSTYSIYEHVVESRRVWVLFSGDTMIRPEYWGQSALHMAFARTAVKWRLSHPFTPLFWFLTAMGYRTYLIMARNFPQRYWPRYSAPTPNWITQVTTSLASLRFGDMWDESRQVIHGERDQCSLATHVAPVTDEVKALPEVDFLINRNPGYAQGDELACVAEITLRDLLQVAIKMLRKSILRSRPAGP